MNALRLEHRIARLLAIGTYLAVTCLVVGIALLLVDAPWIETQTVDTAVVVGLAIVILTPVARVVAAAIGFTMRGERELALIALGVLAVIGLTVVVSWLLG